MIASVNGRFAIAGPLCSALFLVAKESFILSIESYSKLPAHRKSANPLSFIPMPMTTFPKTDKQIKDQIIHWFLKYHGKPLDNFTGEEEFTLFDKISSDKQKPINQLLLNHELPVLVLKNGIEIIVVCTTRRFVYMENNKAQELKYPDFEGHAGFKSIDIPGHSGATLGVKKDGYISEFGLRKTDGQIVYWKIPTGRSGFAFWNVTKKFDIIGRKYIIRETE